MFNNCILFNVRKVEQILTKLAIEAFKPIGIHPSYGYIMQIVNTEGKAIQIKDIAHEMGLSSSTITRMIDKLEDLGYVRRCSSNKRIIRLTEAGEELIPSVEECWSNFHALYNDKVTKETKTNLKQYTNDFMREFEAS